ncbi:DUF3429 domain-containing protein [Neptuniibacter sp. SY11_33]|uniref:DUF3429 domain-containing protein n=1 Tax=Neptuniibacter sp. SY11_33 TaxID=3398215 RepID=UPI0039F56D95
MSISFMLTNTHRWFGYAGLTPFIGLAILSKVKGAPFDDWLLSYAALIYSFLGGVIWFASLATGAAKHQAWVSIIVMLWAWCWLIYPFSHLLVLAGISFFVLWLYEMHRLKNIYPEAFWKLRSHLSVVAGSTLIISGLVS